MSKSVIVVLIIIVLLVGGFFLTRRGTVPQSTAPEVEQPQNGDEFSDFKIPESSAFQIQIISPTGGERWEIGRTNLIKWTGATNYSEVDIGLLLPSQRVEVIAQSIPNNGEYRWAIPNFPIGNGYRIEINPPGARELVKRSNVFSIVSSVTPAASTVIFTDSGYSPSTLTVAKGTAVTFRNRGLVEMWPASAPHPIHNKYPTSGGCIGSTFDACRGIAPAGEWSFKFDIIGSWSYHDHLRPNFWGTIVVE